MLVGIEGRNHLSVIEISSRAEIPSKRVPNPSGSITVFSMKKVPGFDPEKRPYVILKDLRFISLLNIKLMKLLPLVRSPYDMDPINMHNLAILPSYASALG